MWWAARALRSVRRQLPSAGLDSRVPPPPGLSPRAGRGVDVLLRRIAHASCLERALIVQAWLDAQGMRRPVVVGATVDGGFQAHAWLDGYDRADPRYTPLARVD